MYDLYDLDRDLSDAWSAGTAWSLTREKLPSGPTWWLTRDKRREIYLVSFLLSCAWYFLEFRLCPAASTHFFQRYSRYHMSRGAVRAVRAS